MVSHSMQKYYEKWDQYKCLLRWIVSINTVRKLIKCVVNLQSVQWHAKKEPKSSFIWICYFWKYTLSQSPSCRTCCSSNFLISIIIQTMHRNPASMPQQAFPHGNEAISNFSEEISLSQFKAGKGCPTRTQWLICDCCCAPPSDRSA